MIGISSIRFSALRPLAGMCALAVLAVSPSMAVTFAQYVQTNGATQQWAVSTSGLTTTISASGSVLFSFSGVPGFSGPESAAFTLNATSNQLGNCGIGCGPGDSFVQPGYSGTFSFIDTGLYAGTNLLSGTFAVTGNPATTGAQFSSSVGSSGGSFNASATAGNLNQLVLTSAYLNFANQTQEDASWSLSSLIPDFATGVVTGGKASPAAVSFDASGSGTFSSVPGPVTPAPEPATFGLIGGALVSIALFRRKSLAD